MRTSELISALVADARPVARPLRHRVLAWALAGLVAASLAFLLVLGPRTDLAQALATWRFDFKLALVVATAALALPAAVAGLRPTARITWGPAVFAALALCLAVAAELALTPAATWSARLVGSNMAICLTAIPGLSLLPLAALLFALRAGAPASPAAAGAMAGFASAALAASLYATHCTDDSPLFVATWYSLATLLVTAAGAVAGRRLLSW